MAEVHQDRVEVRMVGENTRGQGENIVKAGSSTRSVTIDDSLVEEVFLDLDEIPIEVDGPKKLRPVAGRPPTPLPNDEEWLQMQKEIHEMTLRPGESGRGSRVMQQPYKSDLEASKALSGNEQMKPVIQ